MTSQSYPRHTHYSPMSHTRRKISSTPCLKFLFSNGAHDEELVFALIRSYLRLRAEHDLLNSLLATHSMNVSHVQVCCGRLGATFFSDAWSERLFVQIGKHRPRDIFYSQLTIRQIKVHCLDSHVLQLLRIHL